MSNQKKQDTTPPTSTGTEGDETPTRKRATKKVAAKKVATKVATKPTAAKKTATKKVATKTVTTKVAATKTPAKKVVAKKATKKVASNAASAPEFDFVAPVATQSTPVADPAPTPPATKPARAKKAATPSPAADPASNAPQRRFGRVPGGGPTSAREPSEQPAPAASTPFPSSQPPKPQAENPAPPSRNPQENHSQHSQTEENSGPPRESRSKRRREKRKRRREQQTGKQGSPQGGQPHSQHQHQNQNQNQNRNRQDHGGQAPNRAGNDERRGAQLNGPKIETNGVLELAPKGFGFLRVPDKKFDQARDDVFVAPETIRKYNLRLGQWIHGTHQEGPRGPQLVDVTLVNDQPPDQAAKLPHFDELKAINPSRRISFETTPSRFTTRVVDIMAPVGRGQRGLIVSPPRSGKTTLLLHMAEAIREKYDEAIHLMVVLVDERPEEVTEFRRALPGAEIYASSNDEQPRNHARIAELAIERAKRLVEAGKDVFLIMDSITRLARAYNAGMNQRGRGTGSGGITIGALEVPRRLFAAARNTRGGGSLTILATALIQTNSRADEAIYMEFKGTGNMELVLDRKIAENYIYPAVDIFKSGTRREEILLPDHMLHKIHLIRRGLSGHRPAEAMERLLFFLKKFPNNPQMLLEIKG